MLGIYAGLPPLKFAPFEFFLQLNRLSGATTEYRAIF